MPKMSGRLTSGANKGRLFEIYADPASNTGYTRKQWDENDPNKTEFFEPFNYSAAQADDEIASAKSAQSAADAAAKAAQRTSDDAKTAAFWQGVQQTNERTYQEGVRQFNDTSSLNRDRLNQSGDQYDRTFAETQRNADRDFDLKNLDTRTRLQIGLRQLELSEKTQGASDMRAREQNVMSYLGAIGKLRLPYSELQALSQRAVQGIIPGGAAPGAGAATTGDGALTADQWQALAEGTNRDWEQSQIGQKSALLG